MNIDEDQIEQAIAELRICQFSTPTTEAAKNAARTLLASGGAKNVYQLGNRYVVKFYLAGQQRALVFSDQFDKACRFADLMIRRFHCLSKRRSKHPLTEDSYNLTLTQVQFDTDNEPDIIQALIRLEAVLPEPTQKKVRTSKGLIVQMNEKLDRILAHLEIK